VEPGKRSSPGTRELRSERLLVDLASAGGDEHRRDVAVGMDGELTLERWNGRRHVAGQAACDVCSSGDGRARLFGTEAKDPVVADEDVVGARTQEPCLLGSPGLRDAQRERARAVMVDGASHFD
jgi:hypothetical protein